MWMIWWSKALQKHREGRVVRKRRRLAEGETEWKV